MKNRSIGNRLCVALMFKLIDIIENWGDIMEEYVICSGCGEDTFIIYRTSIECSSCAKTYHFNNTRLVSNIIDVVKEMSDD